MKFKPRDYQIESVNACWEYWRNGGVAPLIIAPTGAGKSVIIADIVTKIRRKNALNTICIVTHSRELVMQNRQRLVDFSPELAPSIGVVSGTLGNDITHPIIFSTIQTLSSRLERLKVRKDVLIIIDEAHRVPEDDYTQYGQYITFAKEQNPNVRFLGLTATPFRMDDGLLVDSNLFDGVAYDIGLKTLIDDGYLVKPTTAWLGEGIKTKSLKKAAGEYTASSHEKAFEDGGGLPRIVESALGQSTGRKKLLWFLPSVATAYQAQEILEYLYEPTSVITNETPNRKDILEQYKNGTIRSLINVNVLTTGFDDPDIDCIILLRATQSTSLYIQMCGRGLRTALGKKDCLILDYGENIRRHGFLDDPTIGIKKSKGKSIKMPIACPSCGYFNVQSAETCIQCGHQFPNKASIVEPLPADHDWTEEAASHNIVSWDPETWDMPPNEVPIQGIFFDPWQKRDKTPTIRVTYIPVNINHGMGEREYHEWLCPNHPPSSYPFKKYKKWLKKFGFTTPFTHDDNDVVSGWLSQSIPAPEKIIIGQKFQNQWIEVLDVIPHLNDSPSPVKKDKTGERDSGENETYYI